MPGNKPMTTVLDDEAKKEVLRKFAGTAIENSHAAIKQVWVAIFAGGTFQLIRSFDGLMGCLDIFFRGSASCSPYLTTMHGNPMWSPDFWLVIALYVIYVLTFYRFYVGNIRVFDIRYIEVGKFVALIAEKLAAKAKADADARPAEKAKITEDAKSEVDALYDDFFAYNNGQNRFGDSIFLIVKTLAIVSLTIEINDPKVFLNIYLIVIVLDLLWMIFARLWNGFRGRRGARTAPTFLTTKYFAFLGLKTRLKERDANPVPNREKISNADLEKIFPSRAIRTWSGINFLCFVLLLLVVAAVDFKFCGLMDLPAGSRLPYWLGIAVMMLNCVLDLFLTWGFYNPTFRKAHDLITGR